MVPLYNTFYYLSLNLSFPNMNYVSLFFELRLKTHQRFLCYLLFNSCHSYEAMNRRHKVLSFNLLIESNQLIKKK